MRRKRRKSKHRVTCNMQVLELTKAGSSMSFAIFYAREKLGTIVIGQGSFAWWGKGKQKGKRMSWSRFAEVMNKHCYGE